jgi:glucokinase
MADEMNRAGNLIGVEVTASSVYVAVVGKTDGIVASRSSSVVSLEDAADQLKGLIDEFGGKFGKFNMLGVAVPGLVDRKTGRVALSANIPSHSEGDLAGTIKAATGLEVVLENDANAAAFGEYTLGAGRGSRNMFYATLGEGVGGAFIFDGEIWRGASGFAGEFGYVPINSEGTRLEDVASSSNIIRRTRSRFHQDSTSSLSKLSEEQITLNEIISAAQNEDDFAQMMLERTGTYVGTGIASVINLLNVEKIVVGGDIMKARHLVLNAIVERARELSFAPSFESTSIVEGKLGQNAAAAGAALIAGSPAN